MTNAVHKPDTGTPAPRRVLMVDSEATWRGGEGQLLLLMRGLVGRGYAITLAAPPGAAIAERSRSLGINHVPIAISGGMDLAAAWRLRSLLRRGAFDIVHCHSSHAHSVVFIANYARSPRARAERPQFVVSRRVDFRVAGNRFSTLKYRHGADLFLAIYNGVREVLVESGVEPGRIRLVPSGIDLDKFGAMRNSNYLFDEFEIERGSPIIGNVAALAPHKSQVDFIRAAKSIADEIDNARFFIVGEGSLRPRLEALIAELDLADRVILTGFRSDVLEILSIFDCFVLSSYLEGLCTSIMDAQALGIPVVATNTGGVPDLVDDGRTGLLVEPRNPEAIASAVLRMLGDGDLRRSCVEAARRKSQAYDYRYMVERTVDAYDAMLSTIG